MVWVPIVLPLTEHCDRRYDPTTSKHQFTSKAKCVKIIFDKSHYWDCPWYYPDMDLY